MSTAEFPDGEDGTNQEPSLNNTHELNAFKLSLNRFSFQPSNTSRPSPTHTTSVRSRPHVKKPGNSAAPPSNPGSLNNRSACFESGLNNQGLASTTLDSIRTIHKRSLPPDSEGSQSSARRKSKSKKARGYAEPSVYAHLGFVQDYLQDDLDGSVSHNASTGRTSRSYAYSVPNSCVLWD
jgi:hypothetical protein